MRALPHPVYFFTDKFAGLGGGRLASKLVAIGQINGPLHWHKDSIFNALGCASRLAAAGHGRRFGQRLNQGLDGFGSLDIAGKDLIGSQI